MLFEGLNYFIFRLLSLKKKEMEKKAKLFEVVISLVFVSSYGILNWLLNCLESKLIVVLYAVAS